MPCLLWSLPAGRGIRGGADKASRETGDDIMNTNVFASHLALDNILDEMNLRARQYCKGNGFSIKRAQEQTAQDFQTYNKNGNIVAVGEGTVKDSDLFVYFAVKS
jgi:hypothetical protein